jgi:hypothetical protein
VAGSPHPALELDQHQFVGAVDQGEILDGAITLAAMMQREMETLAAQPTHFGIAANHDIQGGSQTGHAASQL